MGFFEVEKKLKTTIDDNGLNYKWVHVGFYLLYGNALEYINREGCFRISPRKYDDKKL